MQAETVPYCWSNDVWEEGRWAGVQEQDLEGRGRLATLIFYTKPSGMHKDSYKEKLLKWEPGEAGTLISR